MIAELLGNVKMFFLIKKTSTFVIHYLSILSSVMDKIETLDDLQNIR